MNRSRWSRRSFLSLILALLVGVVAVADAGQKKVHVKGYTKKDGTHVEAYDRKAPDKANHKPAKSSPPPSTSSTQPRDEKGRFVRSESAKLAFMKQSGYPHGRPGFIVDHIVALACGGADAPSNMQWQTLADAKTKDKVERKGCR